MGFDVTDSQWLYNQSGNWNQRLFNCKICSLNWSFCHFGVRPVNAAWNSRLIDNYVLNERAKFGAKYSCIFRNCGFRVGGVLFLTHPVYAPVNVNIDLWAPITSKTVPLGRCYIFEIDSRNQTRFRTKCFTALALFFFDARKYDIVSTWHRSTGVVSHRL